ncbi:hypothetical protein [Phenylobacterium sp.]|uniref:hypothetical protein n=1 Tax=Phenylobacterium sp. TaxID=1871053 RepID=UPI0035ADBDD9
MPHQNPQSSKATAQNAATEPTVPNDQAREQHRSIRPDPRSYAAPDVGDATVTGPAAGELGDYADEGEALGDSGLQQGRDHTRRPGKIEVAHGQGRKTRQANAQIFKGGLYKPKS